MASLQKIKTQINSVFSTQKITKAMELISTAKFAKIKNNLDKVINYYNNVKNVFFNILKHTSPHIDDLLNKKSLVYEKKRDLYIVFGSDLGLCGAYNANILTKINEVVTDEDIIIGIGSKLLKILAKRPNTHIIQTLSNIGDEPNYNIAKIIATKIYDVLQISYLNSVKVIYTKYINPIIQEPIVKEIYPITLDKNDNNQNDFLEIDKSSFEPSADIILMNSFDIFFEASMYYALYSSKLSEIAMRRIAMEQASDNASDLIDGLKLKYNRIRQAKITQEITEIISGSN